MHNNQLKCKIHLAELQFLRFNENLKEEPIPSNFKSFLKELIKQLHMNLVYFN